jgi:hypothetical protein
MTFSRPFTRQINHGYLTCIVYRKTIPFNNTYNIVLEQLDDELVFVQQQIQFEDWPWQIQRDLF